MVMNKGDEKLEIASSPCAVLDSGNECVDDCPLARPNKTEEDGASCYLCTHCGKGYDSEQQLDDHLAEVRRSISSSQASIQGRVTNGSEESNQGHTEDCEDDEETAQMIVDDMYDEEAFAESAKTTHNGDGPRLVMASESPTIADENLQHRQTRAYSCKFCSKLFESNSALNVHYTHTHRDKPQYECDLCGRVYGVKRELATHRRLHDGQPTHRCRQCGKEFGTKQLLRKHELWHTGERSHVCPQCGKAFFQKGHLTQHMMIHDGGRPHACHLCQKTFIFKFDLNRHMKIHAERVGNAEENSSIEANPVASLVTKSTSYESGGSGENEPIATADSNDSRVDTSEMTTPLMDTIFPLVSASAAASVPLPVNAVIQQLHQQHSSAETLGAGAAAPFGLLRTWTPSAGFLESTANGQDHHQRAALAAAFAQVLCRAQQQACLFGGFPASSSPLSHLFFDDQQLQQHQQRSENELKIRDDVTAAGVSEHDSTSGSSPATVDDDRQETASMTDSPPPPACDTCREYFQRLDASQKRIQDLERHLALRQADVDALNAKIQRVTDVASRLLESCSDFDKLWMLHSKQVYSQIQNILNVLD